MMTSHTGSTRYLIPLTLTLLLSMGSFSRAETLGELVQTSSDGVAMAQAFETARYGARPLDDHPEQWWMQNPANGLKARFASEGLSLSVTPPSQQQGKIVFRTGWRTVGFGYGEQLEALPAGKVVTTLGSPRVEIARAGLVEWFVNGKQGLEQGWTLLNRPRGGESGSALRVELALSGDLHAELTADGQEVRLCDASGKEALRYGKLKVWDATGRELSSRIVGGGSTLAVEADDTGAVYPLTIDPTFSQQAYLKASNADAHDNFGSSVAISGDTIVVGADFEDSSATGVDGNQSGNSKSASGAAYVFVRNGGTWSQQAYLKASNTDTWDNFGSSVAISGDTIVVGAYGESSSTTVVNGGQSDNTAMNAGAAYVFVRENGTWSQQAYLKASNAGAYDNFGYSVAISEDTIVVGASDESSSATGVNGNQNDNSKYQAGAAYVFVREGGTWWQQAYLKASNTDASDFFGSSVAISGDTIVVGADFEDSSATGVNGNQNDNSKNQAGAAYVFVRESGTWSQQAYLKASNAEKDDNFGYSVAIFGDTIVVGAYGEDSSATVVGGNQSDNGKDSSGAGYVFVRDNGTWSQQAYLKASNTDKDDNFGYSVAISGDMIVVGAYYESSSATGVDGNQADNSKVDSGAAYVFARNGETWVQRAYLKASNTDAEDNFGNSVAISGDTIVVGAYYESSSATVVDGDQSDNNKIRSGAVYVFQGLGAFSISSTSNSLPAGKSDQSFSVTASEAWTWSISGGNGWISSPLPASQSGNQTFQYTVAANTKPTPRTAVITLTSGPLVAQHTITQAGAAYAILQKPKAFPLTIIGKSSKVQTVRITNGGGSTLTGLRVLAGGSARADYILTQPAKKTLAPKAATTFRITFKPRAAGSRKATLEVRSNAPIVKAPLSGVGKKSVVKGKK